MRMRLARYCVLAGLATSVAIPGPAQSKAAPPPPEFHVSASPWSPPPPALTSESDLVETDVVVRDANGNPVPGLSRDRFQILSDGKPRPLSFFSVVATPDRGGSAPATRSSPASSNRLLPATPSPARFIALVFDDVTTNIGDLGRARVAALRFLQRAYGPGDQFAVLTTSGEQELAFTRDRTQLATAVGALRRHPRASSLTNCPRITPYEAELITRNSDPRALAAVLAEGAKCGDGAMQVGLEEIKAIAQASWVMDSGVAYDQLRVVDRAVAVLAQQPGERSIVFVSGGFISDGLEQMKGDMIERALRANVVINALDAKGLFDPGAGRPIDDPSDFAGPLPLATYQFEETNRLPERQAQNDAMAELAHATGGLFFHDNNDLALGLERLSQSSPLRYNLGFQAVGLKHDGKFHRLQVLVLPPIRGATIQARQGFLAPLDHPTPAEWIRRIDQAMSTQTGPTDERAKLLTRTAGREVTADVLFDVSHLAFFKSGGRRRQQLVLTAALFDPQGGFVVGKRGFLDLALTDNTWKRLRAQGLNAKLSLVAPPGRYRLRLVVLRSYPGKLSTYSQVVTVP